MVERLFEIPCAICGKPVLIAECKTNDMGQPAHESCYVASLIKKRLGERAKMPKTSESEPEFTRRSDTESICMWCFMTVRVTTPDDLANEEREHAATCIQRPEFVPRML